MDENNQKMVVVLVALYRFVNLPIRIMYSILEDIDGITPHIIFFKDITFESMAEKPIKEEEDLFIKEIIKLNPKLVGISVLSPFVSVARRLTKLIHDNTSALVIWGGIHPTISPESCIMETDLICIGEGEGAIRDLVINLRDGEDYFHINNLWINNNNHIIKNNMRQLIEDLDSIPFAAYNKESYYFINNDQLTNNDLALKENTFYIAASRGCPYVCSYCINARLRVLFKGLGNYIRFRSVDNVIKEIKEHLSLPNMHEFIYFVDDVFAVNEVWLNEFTTHYKKEIGLPFFVNYHPELINPTIINKLVMSGLYGISFGIQSGSEYIRKHVLNRPGTNKEIIKLANDISTNYAIKVCVDLILDNPYETEDSLREAISVLLQLPKPLTVNTYSLQFFPKHLITLRAIKDGHIKAEDASTENLLDRTSWMWMFVPRLTPFLKKQMLQNIIWLFSHNYSSSYLVKYAVFSESIGAKVVLNLLNIEAIIIEYVIDLLRNHIWISRLLRGITHVFKGDIAGLYSKIRKIYNIKYR